MGTQTDITLQSLPDLIAFDLETTGTDTEKDRIVELGVVRRVDGETTERRWLLNPERPIPTEATDVHGIRDEDVAGEPTFAAAWTEIEEMLSGPAPLVAYNGLSYDLPLLNAEVERVPTDGSVPLTFKPEADGSIPTFAFGALLDPVVFVRWAHRHRRKRTLEAMCEVFGIDIGKAHSAVDDARATVALVDALILNGDLPSNLDDAIRAQSTIEPRIAEEFGRFTYWIYFDRKTAEMRMGAGKHCGKRIDEVPGSYLDFCAGLGGLTDETREVFRERGRR